MKTSIRSLTPFDLLPLHSDFPLSVVRSLIVLAAIILVVATPSHSQSVGLSDELGNGSAAFAVDSYSIEKHIFALINDERRQNGLSSLAWVERAADSARSHSSDMAINNYFGHSDLNGKHASARADAFGLSDWRSIGENIAWLSGGVDAATRVVKLWMESPGHRENILNRTFRESGVGLARSNDGKIYITQIFILR